MKFIENSPKMNKEINGAINNEKAIVKDFEYRLEIVKGEIRDKKTEMENLGFDPENPKFVPAFVQDKKHEMTNEEWNALLAQHSKLIFEIQKLIKERKEIERDLPMYKNSQEN